MDYATFGRTGPQVSLERPSWACHRYAGAFSMHNTNGKLTGVT